MRAPVHPPQDLKHAAARRLSHAKLVLGLLAPGRPVSIEAMASVVYPDGARPENWAASLRSTVNGLRRVQTRQGAAILCEPDGYRLLRGPEAPIPLPGRFRRSRGFVPSATPRRAA